MAISLNLENPKLFGKGYKTVYNLIAIALLRKVQTLDRCLRLRFHENSKIY